MKEHPLIAILLFVATLFIPIIGRPEYSNSDPSVACDFMKSAGMITGGYNTPDGVGYFCSSPYMELSSIYSLKSNIAYYAEGDAHRVNRLKLVLNVNTPEVSRPSHMEFITYAEILLNKALMTPITQEMRDWIMAGATGSWKIGEVNISLKRIDWPSNEGHELRFIIE